MRALHLHLPVHPSTPGAARGQLRRWLETLGWPREETEDLLLAADEAVSNAVEHAYSAPVRVRAPHNDPAVELHVTHTAATNDTHRAVVTVTDHGRWRPRAVSPGARGRGLQMMRALTDSLEVTATGAGTRVKMVSRAVRITGRRAFDAANRLGNAGALLLLARWVPAHC